MIDHVIVTVRADSGRFEEDMELPSKISIADLAPQLLENLKAMSPYQFSGRSEIRLKCGQTILDDEDTLEKGHVWDGAVLEVL